MAWELEITRRDWIGDEGDDISEEEWLALAAADPELEVTDRIVFRDGSPSVRWRLDPGYETDADHDFVWMEGNISVTRPPVHTIGKMWRIAQALGAEVKDDNGFSYAEDGSETPPE